VEVELRVGEVYHYYALDRCVFRRFDSATLKLELTMLPWDSFGRWCPEVEGDTAMSARHTRISLARNVDSLVSDR
jgi:hypothetical protein